MKVALFGATGGTGREVLAQGLALGHEFQALVRDPSRLGPVSEQGPEGVQVTTGDVLVPLAVAATVRGADAVICVLGSHGSATPVEARGTAVIIEAMQAAGMRRLIAVTSMGVGDSVQQVAPVFRVIMQLTLKKIMAAKEEQEGMIRASGLDWTIVRPGGLTDGPRTGRYQSGTDKAIRAGRVSRADVAEFVLQQLSDGQYIGQAPAIS